MTNNDILRRLRYTFDLSDSKMISVFALADLTTSREEISNWLKSEDAESFQELDDRYLAIFLNGFIQYRRGKKEGAQPPPETCLNNNSIFRKLKIALDLQSDEILKILQLTEFTLSKHELSAFFRKKGHKHYRACKDQVLRKFLKGIQLQYSDAGGSHSKENKPHSVWNQGLKKSQ